MNIQVTQQNLQKALSTMSRIASSRTELPILNNVLISATKEGVEFAATNLEVGVTHSAGGKVTNEGQIAVPARLFHEFVSQLPKDQTVELTLEKNKLLIQAGSYSSHIQGVNPEDFPSLPQINSETPFVLSSEELEEALNKVLLAASRDETRPVLGGVYIHSYKKKVYFTATDGYRLAECRVKDIAVDFECIVPSQALQDVLKIAQDADGDIELYFGEGQFAVKTGNTQLVSRLVDGTYPEYRKLIPEKSDIEFTINKNDFQTAVKLAGLFARESGGSITIKASEADASVTVASVASQVGDNSSRVKASVVGAGEVTVNVKYLNDALGCFGSGDIMFRFGDSIAPCVLSSTQDDGYQHIVMPLKS